MTIVVMAEVVMDRVLMAGIAMARVVMAGVVMIDRYAVSCTACGSWW